MSQGCFNMPFPQLDQLINLAESRSIEALMLGHDIERIREQCSS